MSHTFTVEITDAEYKAFLIRVEDPDKWVEHAVREKVRRCVDYVVEKTVREGYLSKPDLDSIAAMVASLQEIFINPVEYSTGLKEQIINKGTLDTAAVQREKEALERGKLWN